MHEAARGFAASFPLIEYTLKPVTEPSCAGFLTLENVCHGHAAEGFETGQ